MSVFRFRLSTLLRLREADRDERKVRLAEAQRAEQMIQEKIAELNGQIGMARRELAAAGGPGTVDVDRLMHAQRFGLQLEAEQQAAAAQLRAVAAETERRREALTAADREVRILEKLREQNSARFNREQAKREMKSMDEAANRGFYRRED